MKTNILKSVLNLKSFVAGIAFIGLSSFTYGTGKDALNIEYKIKQELKLPEQLKKELSKENSRVHFSIAENGKVDYLYIETSNKALKEFMMNKFENINFEEFNLESGKTYFLDINYKVI